MGEFIFAKKREKMVWKQLRPDVFDVKLAVARLVDHDDRYKLENAAKFRAVNQQVATYDEFKAIVDGCHLKPLDRKEDIQAILKPNEHRWSNTTEAAPTSAAEQVEQISAKLDEKLNLAKVSIYGDFERLWRKVKKDESKSKQLILDLDEKHVFRENCEPLDELVQRLARLGDNELHENNDKIMSILANLSKSKRFGISVAFMDTAAFTDTASLLDRLDKRGNDVAALRNAFA